jgi:hypothetical protein
MLDFVAILSAAQETARRANEARPDAPVRAEPERARGDGRFVLARQRLSLGLRRLADLVEPAPACRPTAVAPRR